MLLRCYLHFNKIYKFLIKKKKKRKEIDILYKLGKKRPMQITVLNVWYH